MGGRSKISQLPDEVRRAIAGLMDDGATVDEITAHLNTMNLDVSRSSVGRHMKRINQVTERMRKSREISQAIIKEFGERPQNKMLQMNVELMQPLIMDLLVAEEDGEPVSIEPKDAMFIASALQKLSQASKDDAAREIAIRKQVAEKAKADAAKAVDEVATEEGLTAATVETIKERILGVKAA